jgi:hypothetical protein
MQFVGDRIIINETSWRTCLHSVLFLNVELPRNASIKIMLSDAYKSEPGIIIAHQE